MNRPPETQRPAGHAPGAQNRRDNEPNHTGDPVTAQAIANADLPQFRSRRAFLIWSLMVGAVPPQRVVERVVAELEDVAP
jgi:hypothetical protein